MTVKKVYLVNHDSLHLVEKIGTFVVIICKKNHMESGVILTRTEQERKKNNWTPLFYAVSTG
jgi:hypothetical protein